MIVFFPCGYPRLNYLGMDLGESLSIGHGETRNASFVMTALLRLVLFRNICHADSVLVHLPPL